MDSSPVVVSKGSQFSSPELDHPIPLKKFYQGEPVALGITQIFIGLIGIVFGILANLIDPGSTHYFWILNCGSCSEFQDPSVNWSSCFHVSKLTLFLHSDQLEDLMKGMLAMNAISAITAGLGMVFLSFSVTPLLPFDVGDTCNYHRYDTKEKCDEIQNIGKGILVFLIVVTILEFCISISVTIFGCKMLCRDPFTETVVVIYQNVAPSSARQDSPFDCKPPAIHP